MVDRLGRAVPLGDLVRAPVEDARGDLRTVTADELGRQIRRDVDPRRHRHRRVFERHDVALAGAEVRVVEIEGVGPQGVSEPRRGPSERSGSIWKIPPLARSLAVIVIRSPVPERESEIPSLSTWSDRLPVSVSPRWPGTLLANRDDAAPTGDVERVGRIREGLVEDREVRRREVKADVEDPRILAGRITNRPAASSLRPRRGSPARRRRRRRAPSPPPPRRSPSRRPGRPCRPRP